MDIVFVTNNKNKIKEVNNMLPEGFNVLSLKDVNLESDIEETGDTLVVNSKIKSDYVSSKIDTACFADDTGLFVEALEGRPGVFSARYAGKNCNSEDNIVKLLDELEYKKNRKAYFKTVICLHLDGKEYFFEGICKGTIAKKHLGLEGFGYDPVFTPDGFDKTFAELSLEQKNKISHRGIALSKLNTFLIKKI